MSRPDTWQEGDPYERYMGRWSRLVARQFLSWLDLPAGGHWLDVGSGTGALTAAILDIAEPGAVTGIDPSEGFVEYAQEHVRDPRADFRVGDANSLPFNEEAFDTVVSGLALNFIPKPNVALAEMARVAKRGGVVAAYVWDYAGEMQMVRLFWDVAVELDPAAVALHQGTRFPICNPGALSELFGSAGLAEVEVRAIDVPARFRDFDDFWLPFLGGQGAAPTYIASLGESERTALREAVRARLPVESGGAISLTARAWAVRGSKVASDRRYHGNLE